MGRLLWLAAALGAAGCGKVAVAPDGPPPDTLKDAVACTTGQLACSAGCVDVQSSSDHCGACDVQCTGVGAMCMAGHCVDNVLSCPQIHAQDASKQSGVYDLADGSHVYCDMEDGGITFSDLSMNNFNQFTGGYQMVTLADLQGANSQKAFIGLFNLVQGDLAVLSPPMDGIGNCLIKVSSTASMALGLGGQLVEPATTATGPINCNATYPGPTLSFGLINSMFPTATMPSDYFATHAPTEIAGSDGNNPAFFWKKVLP